jgi:adenosylmethionine-8-amino-7-oxononanoate aminotransferase
MDASRSYYLACRQHDFAEIDAARCQVNATNIHYVIPANDNSPNAFRLARALARFNDCRYQESFAGIVQSTR